MKERRVSSPLTIAALALTTLLILAGLPQASAAIPRLERQPPLFAINYVLIEDTQGPNPPGNLRMSPSYDTGKSNSDGVTYYGNPRFEWTKPTDNGTCRTADFYQWAVTCPSDEPWDDPRLLEGFTSNTYVCPGTLSDGNYKFWVQAKDNCENWGQWASTDFTIDYTYPTPPTTLNNPGGSFTSANTPNVSWSGDVETGSGVWTYDILFAGFGGNPDHLYVSGDRTLDDVDFGSDHLEDGYWEWKVRVIDVAGSDTSWSSPKPLTVQTDTQGPNPPGNLRMSSSYNTGKSDSRWHYLSETRGEG